MQLLVGSFLPFHCSLQFEDFNILPSPPPHRVYLVSQDVPKTKRFPSDAVPIRIAASEKHFHAPGYIILWYIFHFFKSVVSASRVGGEEEEGLKIRM